MTSSAIQVSRTWHYGLARYANNGSSVGTALSQQRLLRVVKDLLLGSGIWLGATGSAVTPTGAWACRYSCDGTTAGAAGDGVDRLTTDAKVVWAAVGVAHSWIVLRQTGLVPGQNVEICIDCTNGTTTNLTITVSPSVGFSGGTTLNRPTAADEYTALSSTVWGAGGANLTGTVHAMISADGAATRIFITRVNQLQGLWLIESPTDAVDNWVGPIFTYFASSTSGITVSTLSNTANARPAGRGPSSTTFNAFLTAEGGSTLGLLNDGGNQVPSDFDNKDQFQAVGIYTQTYPSRGRAGGLVDLWFYNDENSEGFVGGTIPGCMTYPDNLSRQFNQLGPIVVPWCNTVPIPY